VWSLATLLTNSTQTDSCSRGTPILACPFIKVFTLSGIENTISLLKLQPLNITNILSKLRVNKKINGRSLYKHEHLGKKPK
jgi:hypothetical protein